MHVLRRTQAFTSSTSAQVTLLPIGTKALNFFREETLLTTYVSLGQNMDQQEIRSAADALTTMFLERSYDHILLVYNDFQSAAVQTTKVEQFLPIPLPPSSLEAPADCIYEPQKQKLLQILIPQLLQLVFYKALLMASVSEHGARMTAMNKATDNADELLQSLRITYNRLRQSSITQEISEIVAGVEALQC